MKVVWNLLSEADRRWLLSQVSLVELFAELHRRANQDDDEDLEEGEEEEVELETVEERAYAWSLLAARYPHEIARLVTQGLVKVPKWLQKEILERRREKC